MACLPRAGAATGARPRCLPTPPPAPPPRAGALPNQVVGGFPSRCHMQVFMILCCARLGSRGWLLARVACMAGLAQSSPPAPPPSPSLPLLPAVRQRGKFERPWVVVFGAGGGGHAGCSTASGALPPPPPPPPPAHPPPSPPPRACRRTPTRPSTGLTSATTAHTTSAGPGGARGAACWPRWLCSLRASITAAVQIRRWLAFPECSQCELSPPREPQWPKGM